MKKSELKKVLRPIVKECIQEALLEEGLLSSLISEVVKGLGVNQQPIVEQKQNNNEIKKLQIEEKEKRALKINETRQKMLDAIGQNAYNGVDLFEGTTPMRSSNNSPTSGADPLGNVEPGDPGIDLSKLTVNPGIWKKLAGN